MVRFPADWQAKREQEKDVHVRRVFPCRHMHALVQLSNRIRLYSSNVEQHVRVGRERPCLSVYQYLQLIRRFADSIHV